jgi:hypothetical protein
MNLGIDLGDIGTQLQSYHEKTGTSIDFKVYISGNTTVYIIHIASDEKNTYAFKQAESLKGWLADISADINPYSSAMLRVRAERVLELKLLREADEIALAKEISELPQTQVLLDAQAAAQAKIAEADARLAVVAEATTQLEAEAAAKLAEAAAAEAALAEAIIVK